MTREQSGDPPIPERVTSTDDHRRDGDDVVLARAVHPSAERDETPVERLDRNHAELLQELRVVLAGVQFLFAFLLTLAFTDRFSDLDRFQVGVYVVTLISSALAAVFLIAPVSYHRIVFRHGLKGPLVHAGNIMTMWGLGLLAVAICAAVLLITDVVLGIDAAIVITAVIGLVCLALWYAVPLRVRAGARRSADD